MSESIISEGNTTNEAIENGLKKLNVSRDMVDVKVLENEEKKSFFSILAPRIVKVQLTVKENNSEKKEKKEIILTDDELETGRQNVEKFLDEFFDSLKIDGSYNIEKTSTWLKVDIKSTDAGFLIGYRGETLYALQNVLSSVASKGQKDRVRVILDIEGYKAKREKALQELARNMARNVERTRKSVTLEPMQAYERKIIHTELQSSNKVETRSIGEEPRRRVVIELKRK